MASSDTDFTFGLATHSRAFWDLAHQYGHAPLPHSTTSKHDAATTTSLPTATTAATSGVISSPHTTATMTGTNPAQGRGIWADGAADNPPKTAALPAHSDSLEMYEAAIAEVKLCQKELQNLRTRVNAMTHDNAKLQSQLERSRQKRRALKERLQHEAGKSDGEHRLCQRLQYAQHVLEREVDSTREAAAKFQNELQCQSLHSQVRAHTSVHKAMHAIAHLESLLASSLAPGNDAGVQDDADVAGPSDVSEHSTLKGRSTSDEASVPVQQHQHGDLPSTEQRNKLQECIDVVKAALARSSEALSATWMVEDPSSSDNNNTASKTNAGGDSSNNNNSSSEQNEHTTTDTSRNSHVGLLRLLETRLALMARDHVKLREEMEQRSRDAEAVASLIPQYRTAVEKARAQNEMLRARLQEQAAERASLRQEIEVLQNIISQQNRQFAEPAPRPHAKHPVTAVLSAEAEQAIALQIQELETTVAIQNDTIAELKATITDQQTDLQAALQMAMMARRLPKT